MGSIFAGGPNTTILQQLSRMSVRVGALFVPARNLESHLGNFSKNLMVWNHDDIFKVSLIGSCCPIKYRGKYFVVCTKHQIKNVDPKDLCLLRDDGSSAVTSSGIRMWNSDEPSAETDAHDIAILNYTEPCEVEVDLRSYFFNFNEIPPDGPSDRIVALVGAGYPSADQVYELHETNHLGTFRRVFLLELDGKPLDQSILRAKTTLEMSFLADGLSGGPVFVIQLHGEDFQAFYAGMILRAGNGFVYFLKSGFIQAALDSSIETFSKQ